MSGKAAKRARAQQRVDLGRIFRHFLDGLRATLKREAPAYYERFPDAPRPCHTCAFNPGTDDWRGADRTALNLSNALHDRQPFFCHELMPYSRAEGWRMDAKEHAALPLFAKSRPCAGWWVVKDSPDARRAFTRACAGRSLTDDEVDRLTDIFGAARGRVRLCKLPEGV